MPILEERHDLAHPVEGDSAWSESYYFNAYDPASDTGLFTRIGVRPNEGTLDVGCSVWLPGQEIAHVFGVREQKTMVDRVLEVGGVRYELVAPMKEWRLTANAEAHVRDLATGAKRRTPLRSRPPLRIRTRLLPKAASASMQSENPAAPIPSLCDSPGCKTESVAPRD